MNVPTRAWKGDGVCIALLIILALVPLYPMLLHGAVPMDLTPLFELPPWSAAHPPNVTPSTDPLAIRDTHQLYPAYAFLHQSAQNGQSILWNPLERTGEPFFARWDARALSPFSIPFYLFGLNTALKLSAFLKLLAAGATAYYAARRLGIGPPLALFTAVSFQWSAALLIEIAAPLSDTAPWFPLLFLFTERAALGQYRHWPTGAAVFALMLLGGHPPSAIAAAVMGLLYLLVRTLWLRTERRPILPIAVWTGAMAIGLVLISIQAIPALEYQRNTHVLRETAPSPSPVALLRVIMPRATLDAAPPAEGAFHKLMFHAGIISIVLAFLWCALRLHMPRLYRLRYDILLILAFLIPCAAAILPLGSWHALYIFPFFLALTAAAAAQAWLELNPEQCNATLRRLTRILPIPLLACVIVWFATATAQGWSAIALDTIIAVVLAAAAALLLTITLIRPSAPLLGFGFTFLAAGNLLWATAPEMRFTPANHAFPQTAFIDDLQSRGVRVVRPPNEHPWPTAVHQLPSSAGNAPRVLHTYATAFNHDIVDLRSLGALSDGWFLLDKRDTRGAFAQFRPSLEMKNTYSSGMGLFHIIDPPSRAFITFDVRTGPLNNGPTLDFTNGVHVNANAPPPPPTANPSSQVTIVEESNTTLTIDAEASAPGLLVTTAADYPGWSATIGGQPAPVLRVNGIFRGVMIPAGEHRVQFRYEPPWLKTGLALSAAAALAVGAGWLYLLSRWLRRPKPPAPAPPT